VYGRRRSAATGRDRRTSSPRTTAASATASRTVLRPMPSGPCSATEPPPSRRAWTAASRSARPNSTGGSPARVSSAISPGRSAWPWSA
jgi:hypothetical protein